MTDSAMRIANFYFPQKKEASRVDIKTNTKIETFEYYMSPYSILQDRGHNPTNIVVQGFIDTFTTGSTGAWGLEKLKAEVNKPGEKILEVGNFDDTNYVRRYYVLTQDLKYITDGSRPNLYDYLFTCQASIPWALDATAIGLQTAGPVTVGGSDTSFTFTGNTAGSHYSEPIFVLSKAGGSSVSTTLTISDGATTSTGNYISFTGILGAGQDWILFPCKFNNSPSKMLYLIKSSWLSSSHITYTTDFYENHNYTDGGLTIAGTVTGVWPRVLTDGQTLKCKITGGDGTNSLYGQYRRCYG